MTVAELIDFINIQECENELEIVVAYSDDGLDEIGTPIKRVLLIKDLEKSQVVLEIA